MGALQTCLDVFSVEFANLPGWILTASLNFFSYLIISLKNVSRLGVRLSVRTLDQCVQSLKVNPSTRGQNAISLINQTLWERLPWLLQREMRM